MRKQLQNITRSVIKFCLYVTLIVPATQAQELWQGHARLSAISDHSETSLSVKTEGLAVSIGTNCNSGVSWGNRWGSY